MAVTRPETIRIGERSLPLPVYFPSISSVKTTLHPQEYMNVLSSFSKVKQFLVSAFDLSNIEYPHSAQEMLASARQAEVITLMDSGNYESF